MKTGNEYQNEIKQGIRDIIAMDRMTKKGVINPTKEVFDEVCSELHETAIEYSINYKKHSDEGLQILKNLTYEDATKFAMDIQLITFFKVKPSKKTYEEFQKEFSFIKPGTVKGGKWEYPE